MNQKMKNFRLTLSVSSSFVDVDEIGRILLETRQKQYSKDGLADLFDLELMVGNRPKRTAWAILLSFSRYYKQRCRLCTHRYRSSRVQLTTTRTFGSENESTQSFPSVFSSPVGAQLRTSISLLCSRISRNPALVLVLTDCTTHLEYQKGDDTSRLEEGKGKGQELSQACLRCR